MNVRYGIFLVMTFLLVASCEKKGQVNPPNSYTIHIKDSDCDLGALVRAGWCLFDAGIDPNEILITADNASSFEFSNMKEMSDHVVFQSIFDPDSSAAPDNITIVTLDGDLPSGGAPVLNSEHIWIIVRPKTSFSQLSNYINTLPDGKMYAIETAERFESKLAEFKSK